MAQEQADLFSRHAPLAKLASKSVSDRIRRYTVIEACLSPSQAPHMQDRAHRLAAIAYVATHITDVPLEPRQQRRGNGNDRSKLFVLGSAGRIEIEQAVSSIKLRRPEIENGRWPS
jgi:hypothetical protein